ncbi:MAG: Dabb family protein [Planctomycetota bacterium]
MLIHSVYFRLEDASEGATQSLLDAAEKYLTGHPGTVSFAVGTRVADLNRPVNDDTFDVALHVVFESRAAHDAYQVAERHEAFIAEQKGNWAEVRVFDSET